MKNSKKIMLLLLIAALVFSAGCKSKQNEAASITAAPEATEEPVEILSLEDAIEGILKDRLTALENDDYDLYMKDIGKSNELFFNEQERWFGNMTEDSITGIEFFIDSVEMIDEATGVVTVRQKHTLDKTYYIKYPLLFVLEDSNWMDYGYHFNILETQRFVVKYMDDETRLEEFTQMLNDAYDNLAKVYEESPMPNYEMKLFSDREMLRQRTIPAHTWLFTGWSEPDESLKVFTGHPEEYTGYPGLVQHELVHHITINMCKGNLPGWLLEGIAMYDGTAHYDFENSTYMSSMTEDGISQTIAELEALDLNNVESRQQVIDFYTAGYMYVRYIDEVYGREKLMDIFYEAGKKPYQDSALDDEYEIKNQATAAEVFMTILGLTKEELSAEYLAWLDTFDFESISQ